VFKSLTTPFHLQPQVDTIPAWTWLPSVTSSPPPGKNPSPPPKPCPARADFLAHFQTLSKRYSAGLARAALEIAILRLEAAAKFPFAEKLYWTRPALEQASSHPVAAYRAERYRPFSRLADLGCSAGGDTLAMAALAPTLGLDLDPLRLALARANLAALGLAERAAFVQADLAASLPLPSPPSPLLQGGKGSAPALFFDPARRSGHRRLFSVEDYHPPLSIIQSWLPRFPALGVKLSPGVELAELSAYGNAELEFISLKGELKEAVLWFGPLRTAARRATVLTGPPPDESGGYPSQTRSAGFPYQAPVSTGAEAGPFAAHTLAVDTPSALHALPPNLSEPLSYLYEPDPAILRAGLVRPLAEQLSAAQLDPDIAYLTADRPVSIPFARCWPVEAWFPFQLKRLRTYLRQHHVGHVTVKKRGSPLEPEALIRDLRLSGEESRVVVLTHLRGEPIVIVCAMN
jgi:SAM-dependent methyltransferase